MDGVTHLDGALTLGGTVSDLSKLRCLTVITGGLVATNATALTELHLDGLMQVGGQLYVSGAGVL